MGDTRRMDRATDEPEEERRRENDRRRRRGAGSWAEETRVGEHEMLKDKSQKGKSQETGKLTRSPLLHNSTIVGKVLVMSFPVLGTL